MVLKGCWLLEAGRGLVGVLVAGRDGRVLDEFWFGCFSCF